ncbi:MAG: flagellar biosynthetic protein FliR [Planctomycetaceae bacterium]
MMEFLFVPLVLCFLRVSAFVVFLPPFGGQHIPNTVKVGLVMALTAFWAPTVISMTRPVAADVQSSSAGMAVNVRLEPTTDTGLSAISSRQWLLWGWLGIREVTLGAALGWLLGMIVVPIRIAGSWLAELIGLNMASVTSMTDTGSGNVLSAILETCGILLLYSFCVHHEFLRIFNRFFHDYQVGQAWVLPESGWITATLTHLPERGLAIAAPMALIMTLTLVVMLFAMKQSPQFNLLTFGMPFRLTAGLLGLMLVFPDMLAGVARHLHVFLHHPAVILSSL